MKAPWGTKPRPNPIGQILKQALLGLLVALLGGGAVMLLWNYVLPSAVPGVQALTFPQGLALLVLARLLFYTGAGFGRRGAAAQAGQPPKLLPEEDRAAFLHRIRQRLSEAEHAEKPKFSN